MSTVLFKEFIADLRGPNLTNDEARARHSEFIHAEARQAAEAAMSAYNSAMMAGPDTVAQWRKDHADATALAQKGMRDTGTSEETIAEWTRAKDAIVDAYVSRTAGFAAIERAIDSLTQEWRKQ